MDSLWTVYNNMNQADTNRLKAIQDIAWSYRSNKPDTAIILAEQERHLAEKTNQKEFEGKAYNTIGSSLDNKSNYPSALEYYLKAFKKFEEIGDKKRVGNVYYNMGLVYQHQSDYPTALECSLKALEIRQEIGYKQGVGECYNTIGIIYIVQGNYAKALEYLLKSLEIAKENKDKQTLGFCYVNIGIVYGSQSDFVKALDYQNKALKILEELGDKNGIGNCYGNIGIAYQHLSDYSKAIQYELKDLQIQKEIGNKEGAANCYNNMGVFYNKVKKYKLAIEYIDSGLRLTKEIGDINTESFLYQNISDVYAQTGIYQDAYNNYVQFTKLKDSIFNTDKNKQLGDLKTNFEVTKKETEMKAQAEAQQAIDFMEKRKQRLVIYGVAGILLLVIIFSFSLYRRFKITQGQNVIIEKQKGEVEKQRELAESERIIAVEQSQVIKQQKIMVEEHRKEMVQSITYAKRLQQAIFPSDEEILKCFPESILIFKPKDIVAGDFYWMEQSGETTFIAAADSTGHGVPGALVSVVCSNALNRAVKEFGLRETGEILDKTRELVLETFAKSNSEVRDGMDISLLSFNKHLQKISWSGANNPLWYMEQGELKEIRADKQPIGKTDNPGPFITHSIKWNRDTVFYLLTDGFADQFGGPVGKKFMYKQLKSLLVEICSKPFSEQQAILSKSFDEWKGNQEQTDDVTLIGIKL